MPSRRARQHQPPRQKPRQRPYRKPHPPPNPQSRQKPPRRPPHQRQQLHRLQLRPAQQVSNRQQHRLRLQPLLQLQRQHRRQRQPNNSWSFAGAGNSGQVQHLPANLSEGCPTRCHPHQRSQVRSPILPAALEIDATFPAQRPAKLRLLT